jgi:hypothetical protein
MTIKAEDESRIDELGKQLEKVLPNDFMGKVEFNISNGRFKSANVTQGLLRKEDGRERAKT